MSANSEQFAYVENIGNIDEKEYEYKSIAKANNKAKAIL